MGKIMYGNVPYAGGGGGSAAPGTELLYTGRESQYTSDSSNTPIEFDTRTSGTKFSSYLSTSDYATFTVVQDFLALVTYGIEQDPNQTSSNRPGVTFFQNGAEKFTLKPPSATSGSNAVGVSLTIFCAGDTFFWGSNSGDGYPIRLGQIDLVDIDITNYTRPSFPVNNA